MRKKWTKSKGKTSRRQARFDDGTMAILNHPETLDDYAEFCADQPDPSIDNTPFSEKEKKT